MQVTKGTARTPEERPIPSSSDDAALEHSPYTRGATGDVLPQFPS